MVSGDRSHVGRALVCRAATRRVAVPIEHVVETMRPLPITPLPAQPPFVLGAAVVRGAPTPVIDVASLLGEAAGPSARLVTVRGGRRPIALAVSDVLGVLDLTGAEQLELRTLLAAVDEGPFASIHAHGPELLVVLRAARLVPDAVWPLLEEAS